MILCLMMHTQPPLGYNMVTADTAVCVLQCSTSITVSMV